VSAREALQAAVVAQIRGRASLAPLSVFDMPPDRGAMPFAVVDEPVLARWDAAKVEGFEGRITVSASDDAERPVRLRRLAGLVDDLVHALPADLGADGWRVATIRLVRGRIARGRDRAWTATSEFAVRVYRAQG
jgi:hypothetical protein